MKHFEALQGIFELQDLDELDKSVVCTVCSNPAITTKQLSNLLGIGRNRASAIRKSARVRRAINVLIKPARQIITDVQSKAARVLASLLDCDDEYIQIKAASIILKPLIDSRPSKDGDFTLVDMWKIAFDGEEDARKAQQAIDGRTIFRKN